MELLKISDISTMSGVKITSTDILLPKDFYEDALTLHPLVLNKVSKFFSEHPKVKAVVIRGGIK